MFFVQSCCCPCSPIVFVMSCVTVCISGVARLLVMVGPRWGTPPHKSVHAIMNTQDMSPSHCGLFVHLYRKLIKVYGCA